VIRFQCECGQPLQAREESAGLAMFCPACGRRTSVPDLAEGIQFAEPAEERPRRPAGVQQEPSAEWNEEWEDRPRRRPPIETSNKAVWSLGLGVLAFFLSILTGIPAIVLGLLGLREIEKSRGRLQGKGLAIGGIVTGGIGTLIFGPLMVLLVVIPLVQRVRQAEARAKSANNLKLMGLAMHKYHDTFQFFPPAAIFDRKDGKPLLSWRVLILPFIEQDQLFNQFHLDEPWDSDHNKPLLSRMPKIYAYPGDDPTSGLTPYQVFVGPMTIFEGKEGHGIIEITDGSSNTILVAEAETPVPWTKPEDLPFDPNKPLPRLGGRHRSTFNALFADGSVHVISTGMSDGTLRALITRNGGEVVAFP
jgi:prepilin-type processing-associated H-X9-DG protein